MMKKFLFLILVLFFSTVLNAQNNYKDVVYLKNGSIIRGIIIEQVPNKLIKIQTEDKSVFVFKFEEIEKIAKEIAEEKDNNKKNGLSTGYKGLIEFGYEIKAGKYGLDRLKFDFINSIQSNPYFSLGIGLGSRYYFDANAILVPIFSDIRINFIDKGFSPYLSLDLGYAFNASNDFKGVGIMIHPVIGACFRVVNNSFMNIGVGSEFQNISIQHYYGSGFYNENCGSLSINIGLSF